MGARLANMTRRGLIHDSASGPIDFSGPRCILPIGSSAFHEPALARQRVYARLRVLECSLFRLDLKPPHCQDRDVHFQH
jgi:hypothetical protein